MYPDFEKEFIIYTDASNLAFGAILAQLDENGRDQPVAYTSRVMNKHIQNHTVTEKECLAVIFAVKQFRHYIYGTHFTVVTDHSLLRWLQNLRSPKDDSPAGHYSSKDTTSRSSTGLELNIKMPIAYPECPS